MPGYDHLYGSTQTSGGTGTSSGAVGGYTPPSGGGNNNQNNNQNTTPIVDVAAEQDAADDAYATSLFGGNENHPPAIPANEVYGPGSTDPGMGYALTNVDPNLLPKLGLDKMDPKVLESFGYATLNEDGSIFSTKGTTIPSSPLIRLFSSLRLRLPDVVSARSASTRPSSSILFVREVLPP